MKIAVYVDENGSVASFHQRGGVHLYEKRSRKWASDRFIPFSLGSDMTLAQIQGAVSTLVTRMAGCRVFLSADVRGLPYAILQQGFGLRVWKSAGPLLTQLDFVAAKERERIDQERETACTQNAHPDSSQCGGKRGGCHDHPCNTDEAPAPSSIAITHRGAGDDRINLIEVLKQDPGTNSRQVLLPFLRDAALKQLEVICDHLPRWLDHTLDELNLMAKFETPPGAGATITALISPQPIRTETDRS